MKIDELEEKLTDIRAALDEIDDCKFGQVGKFLDHMARMVDEAVAMASQVRAEMPNQERAND